ncbi:hypothetical protein Pmani_027601 [Petrolisthes manimaculis]|uniref:Uncharacterized protein n=1 Tax=Petrolisthes manimaculis TaxID=1843537 RepID=A0AAE1P3U0_9EUCA|nr:hypothetical protein Pmani_027600 [Petrolisthes manimaculis]KAK4300187.1 hypothetical protein Pmani_027601 [Petrolisthes manimaculis]
MVVPQSPPILVLHRSSPSPVEGTGVGGRPADGRDSNIITVCPHQGKLIRNAVTQCPHVIGWSGTLLRNLSSTLLNWSAEEHSASHTYLGSALKSFGPRYEIEVIR